LWPLLVEARSALSALDGIGKALPNPELLLRPLQYREAQRSSSLEGTVTDPRQQVLFEIEPQYPKSAADPRNALREVFNYGLALRLRRTTHASLPLSLRLIRELHRTLLDGVRGSDQRPGEFRRTQNQIGRPPRYVPPPPNELGPTLSAMERFLHHKTGYDPLVKAYLVHYQLEAIHPFGDGNGRVGRLLLTILIAEWCEMSGEWLYMSPFFEANRDAYIDHLFRVSADGDWRGWIEFCLRGTIEQARDTEDRCGRLLELNRSMRSRIEQIKASFRLSQIIDHLFASPVIKVSHIAKRLGVSYNTARADLEKLASARILNELPGAYPKSYYSTEILDITFEDSN
jgi:Fic family protein